MDYPTMFFLISFIVLWSLGTLILIYKLIEMKNSTIINGKITHISTTIWDRRTVKLTIDIPYDGYRSSITRRSPFWWKQYNTGERITVYSVQKGEFFRYRLTYGYYYIVYLLFAFPFLTLIPVLFQ